VPIVITTTDDHHGDHTGDRVAHPHDDGDRPSSPPPPPPAAHARPIYLQWWAWGAASAAFAATGIYFGTRAQSDADQLRQLNANSQSHQFGEALAIESTGHRDVLLCNTGLATAGAFAIGAGVLYLTAPRAASERRVVAVPLRGGGALVIGGQF
jgi:hypothetical protein